MPAATPPTKPTTVPDAVAKKISAALNEAIAAGCDPQQISDLVERVMSSAPKPGDEPVPPEAEVAAARHGIARGELSRLATTLRRSHRSGITAAHVDAYAASRRAIAERSHGRRL